MGRLIVAMAFSLGGCAADVSQCERDFSRPMQVYVPVAGMVVQRTVYPCRGN